MHAVKNIINGSYFRELAAVPAHGTWTPQRSKATWMPSDRAHQLAREIRSTSKDPLTREAFAVVSLADGWLVGTAKHAKAITRPTHATLFATPKGPRASGIKFSCR